ncbi:hypothetical protein BV22DRAFT_501870 [Leucogyrophana mollusca]|uniref:Uncharacterized protein n=1 Tax=Leucogyrophana mollusca TaxID=85980 RepID=A0ACB8BG22_9AGAM|nr:hypothetical protein BV22DRAFT_501870 [Leucogyrophana mollusca]
MMAIDDNLSVLHREMTPTPASKAASSPQLSIQAPNGTGANAPTATPEVNGGVPSENGVVQLHFSFFLLQIHIGDRLASPCLVPFSPPTIILWLFIASIIPPRSFGHAKCLISSGYFCFCGRS